jgi:3-phenylpropionate/trans-cinnamate dioxygenase ferredoxin reductase subunit
MSTIERVIVVGGGLAGANAAFALRNEGFDGSVTMLADENDWPYERPPISKQYLRAEYTIEQAYVRPPAEYDANRIEIRRGVAALAIDPVGRKVATSDGAIGYDALILATGATPRRLDLDGAQLKGIHYLRDRGDADALRDAAANANDIVVVGGGWVGSEVAASLRQLGRPVTFLTSHARPLEHVLGAEVADVYKRAHQEHGVRFVRGRVSRLHGNGRVDAVETDDGRKIAADLVVVGVGAIPRGELLTALGAATERGGIAVDEHLRTSLPSVYAIGDVATAWNPRYGRSMRLEHWDNAIEQGKAVAANIVGRNVVYDRVPYLYSDQYDVGMEYRGFAPDWDQVVVRGDVERREFHAFWLRHGRLSAAMNVNLWDDGDDLQALVESSAPVDIDRLRDVDVPLAKAA